MQIVKWEPWDYLLELLDIIQNYSLIYILKASQLGISWLLAGYNDWVANFNKTAKCLLLSQGQNEAKELLSKVNFIHTNIPDYMRMPIDADNRELISFKGSHADIMALPSTMKAGHGYQASVVTRDELARHEYARENFKAVSRAVDSGGKLIELSTSNKLDNPGNYFDEKTSEFYHHPDTEKKVLPSGMEIYTNPNRPDTCLVFLSWRLRPVRLEGMSLDDWWNSRIVPKYTSVEIEEQYPSVIEDVFKPIVSESYFEFQALEDMMQVSCPPMNKEDIKQEELNTFNGMVRYYKPPIKGRRYVEYTDPSDGVGDPFVIGVRDVVTGEIVCSATGKIKVDRVAEIHDYIAQSYKADNSFEANAVGIAFQQCLDDLKTPNQMVRRNPEGKIVEGKKGVYVEGVMKHMVMFPKLAFEIAHRQLVCHDREFMQQAMRVQRGTDSNGKSIALTPRKMEFDWVMMMGGLSLISSWLPRGGFKIETLVPNKQGKYGKIPIMRG